MPQARSLAPTESLVEEIGRGAALPLNESVQALLNAVGKFCAGAPFRDDVCIIVAEATGK
jgi:hypothetical protein